VSRRTDLTERFTDLGFAAGWGVVKALPHPVAAAGFRVFADRSYRKNGKGVRRLRANLRRVVGPELPEAELDALTRQAMRSYARYWLEVFRLPRMVERAVAGAEAGTVGAENIDNALAAGKGVILALPHSGNWEVAAAWLIDRAGPFTTVAERLKPESLYRRFLAYRESLGMRVVPLSGGDRSPSEVIAERLRQNGVVCLLGDRDLTKGGVEVSFFGEPTKMPAGPALLAATTGAALLPVGLWFDGDGWGQRVHPPVPIPRTGPLRDKVRFATQYLADRFAGDIAEHPADWHMLQRLWLADLAPVPASTAPPAAPPERPAVESSAVDSSEVGS
jgi:lauroyl/myristoyl acyltransferase